eukprot:13648535-Alexandrium_andersonii.AAC.1
MQLCARSTCMGHKLHLPDKVFVDEGRGQARVHELRPVAKMPQPVELCWLVPQKLALGIGQASQLRVGAQQNLHMVQEVLGDSPGEEEAVGV